MGKKSMVDTPITPNDLGLRERGLVRALTTGQLTMIGLGGAIGTGLFMGSGIAIAYAGPAVVISYGIAALLALAVMYSLSEMALAHPNAGSFGVYADVYLNPWAGFVVRATYAAAQIFAMGGEAVAIGHYLNFWWPDLPVASGAFGACAMVIWLNARKVADLGLVEFVLSSVKVIAIVLFIIFGLANIFGLGAAPIGFDNYFVQGGPVPHGLWGIWMAVLMAIFSFIGIEMIAVAAGESVDPTRAVPAAMRTMLWRLVIFYGLGLAIMVAVVPWDQAGAKLVTESPFVRVFANFGLPFAASIMNMVVILAALSSMNALLYLSARMLFSLGRQDQAPAALGRLSADGVPQLAVMVAGLGVAAASATALWSPAAYNYLLGIALFGAIWTWGTILATHIRFRAQQVKSSVEPNAAAQMVAPFAPAMQYAALGVLVCVCITMALDQEFWNVAILVGIPWILILSGVHLTRRFLARGKS